MADKTKFWIDLPGREPIKVLRNMNRPGAIIRQGPSVIFADIEVADRLLDALDAVLAEVQR